MHASSPLRKTLALGGHKVGKVTETEGMITAQLVPRRNAGPVCSGCGKRRPGYGTLPERTWRHVPLWGTPVAIACRPRRACCAKRGIAVEEMSWSEGKSTPSVPLIVVLSSCARLPPWQEVARLFSVSWNTAAGAVASAAECGPGDRDTRSVAAIGMDEVARRKGHRCPTMAYDLTNMSLLWCGEGRDKAPLRAFFAGLTKEEKQAVKTVCCDVGQPYTDVAAEEIPHAIQVFDKFHLIERLSEAVDEVRRQEARKLKDTNPEVLQKARYIFPKNPENLTEGQGAGLSGLGKPNLKVNRAYLLREAFRSLWDHRDPARAESYPEQWIRRATRSRLNPCATSPGW